MKKQAKGFKSQAFKGCRIGLTALSLAVLASNAEPSLDEILRAGSATALQQALQESNRSEFLKLLCEKQKQAKKPPTACFELKQNADRHCLRLKTEDLDIEILTQALSSSFLSPPCRKHLEEKKKVLIYRRKDRLIPGL